MLVHIKRNVIKILLTLFVLIALFSCVRLEANNHINNNKIVVSAVISDKIYIDGNEGWVNFKNSGGCTGAGLPLDPYIIRGLIINSGGTGNCIEIINSDVYFIIENCELTTSEGSGFRSGNIKNGRIINNQCSHNYVGITIENSQDMIIQGNTVYYNTIYGINIFDSSRNIICENEVRYTSETAIYTELGKKNQVFNNIVTDSGQWGIAIIRTTANEIYGNRLSNNAGGSVYFEDSSCVIFFQNDIDDDSMEYVVQNTCPFTSELITYLVIGVLMLVFLSGGVIVQKRSIRPREKMVEKKEIQVEAASKSDEMIEMEEKLEEKEIPEVKKIPSKQFVEEEFTPIEAPDMAEKTVIREEKIKTLESEEKSPYAEIETEHGQIGEVEEVYSEKLFEENLLSSQVEQIGEEDIVEEAPITAEEIVTEEGISSEDKVDKELIVHQEGEISEVKLVKDYESEAEVAETITMLPTGNLICPYCGFRNADDASYCVQCGQTIKK